MTSILVLANEAAGLGTVLPWWAQLGAFGLLVALLCVYAPRLLKVLETGSDKIAKSVAEMDINHRADRKAQEERHAEERERDATERTRLYELLATRDQAPHR